MSISIIIPLYNKAQYLREMLLSLLPQLLGNDELIIVDDCSTDNGLETIADLIEDRVRIIQMKVNLGPASARNKGAAAANGEFLLFFDADDIAHPSMLEVLHAAIQTHPMEHVFTFGIAYSARGEVQQAEVKQSISVLPTHAFVKSALRGKPICTASSTCVSKMSFESSGGFCNGLRYSEDPEFWVRLTSCYGIVHINRMLATYRDVANSLSYVMRVTPGSVAPYVKTLLNLDKGREGDYYKLARSVIRKNLLFSISGGANKAALLRYLTSMDGLLGAIEIISWRLIIVLPSKFLITGLFRIRIYSIRLSKKLCQND